MARRTALPGLLAASLAGALLAFSGSAEAAGAWLTGGTLTPAQHRVAVAVGPARTTLWTNLSFDAAGGPMAIVIPAAPGSALDVSSDAWFEALEVATAPRVFPPASLSPFCPGKPGSPNVFELDGDVSHTQSLEPQNVAVLADAGALSTWAAQSNLTIPAPVAAALSGLSGVSFVAVLFAAPPGSSVTPTLRLSTPNGTAVLPLALTRAGGSDLKVTAWMIGQGEADLGGGVQVVVDSSKLVWNATTEASNYQTLRAGVLAVGPDAFLVEAAGHAPLSQNVSIAEGTASIDGVVTTFFERAAAYGDGDFDAAACVTAATTSLASTDVVAAVCPRAALGVISPAPTCTESPAPGQVDPSTLRCGPGADDLALALSGLTPASAWVTRQSLLIPANGGGVDAALSFAPAASMSPVLTAQSVDESGCNDGGAGSSSSSSGSATGSSSGSMSSGSTSTGSGYTGSDVGFDVVLDDDSDVVDAVSDTGCDCSGTSATAGPDNTTSDACSGSGSDGSCSGNSSTDDASSSSSSCSGSDSSSSSCSGNSDSSGSCSSGSGSSDSCSGDSGGDSCSGDSAPDFKCTMARPHHLRAPKLSILLMAALAVAAPLRRRGRRRRPT
jgi:hypothetical protein